MPLMTKRESLHKTAESWGYQVDPGSDSLDTYQRGGHRLSVRWSRNGARVLSVNDAGKPVYGGYFAAFYLLSRRGKP